MVFLRAAILIMDFLTGEDERTFLSNTMVSINPLHQGVVVCNQEHIHASLDSCTPQICVGAGPIGVGGVHVQVDGQFVHM
jgi:hypothetical protein